MPESTLAVGWLMLELLSDCFQFKGDSNLDLWPCDPKINRGLLPNMDNHPMKFEYCGPNGTYVMLWKPFSVLS
jgi:hypothetical protein